MSQAINDDTTPTRRSAMRLSLGAALGALAAPAVATAAGNPDAELIALSDRIMAADAERDRLSEKEDGIADSAARWRFREDVIMPMVREGWDMRADLATMRATTIEGFRAKARVIQQYNNCAPGYASPYNDDAMAWSLANDILGVPSVWANEDAEAGA